MKIPFAPASVVWRETRDRRLGIKLRFSNYGSVTTLQQPRPSNQTTLSLQQLRFSNYASATTLQQPKPTLASATKPQQPKLTTALAGTCVISQSHPPGKYMRRLRSHILHDQHPTPSGNKRQWTPTMTSVPGALGPWSVIPGMASGDWRNSERFAWEQDPLSEISRDRISP